jgi:hypothetical protein
MDNQQHPGYDLGELKRQIDEATYPLIPHLKSPVDRYQAYESLLRDNWSDELAYKAFEEAKQIDNPEDRFYSLQSLSSAIYFHTQDLHELEHSGQPEEQQHDA